MTFPDDELTELASAFLDGAATSDERARVEADQSLMARVDELRMVRDQLAALPPVAAADRERHLLAAFAVYDQKVVAIVPTRAGAPSAVSSLDEARRRRARRLAPVLSIAAATVLVVGVGLLAINRGDDASTSSEAARTEAAAATGSAAPDTDANATAPAATDPQVAAQKQAASTVGGPVADPAPASPTTPDPVIAAAAESVSSPTADVVPEGGADEQQTEVTAAEDAPVDASSTEELPAAVDTKVAQRQSDEPVQDDAGTCTGQPGEALGPITWQGQPGLLYVIPNAQDPQEAVVLDPVTCATLVRAPLPA